MEKSKGRRGLVGVGLWSEEAQGRDDFEGDDGANL
jgi:hypothetical protein